MPAARSIARLRRIGERLDQQCGTAIRPDAAIAREPQVRRGLAGGAVGDQRFAEIERDLGLIRIRGKRSPIGRNRAIERALCMPGTRGQVVQQARRRMIFGGERDQSFGARVIARFD